VAGKVPLRTVLIVPFVFQIVGTVGLVGYLSARNGQEAIEDLAYQLMDQVDHGVEQNLQHYLDVPKHINQSLAAAIHTGVLNWKNFSGLERYFAQQLQAYDTVSNVAIATEQKEFLSVEKSLASDALIIRVLNQSTNYAFHYYAADRQGKRIKLTKVRNDYNPHNDPPQGRPWYRVAQQAGQAIWLPVVNLSQGVDHPILTMVNFLPFLDSDGNFQGVLAASLYLPQFTSFLESLEVGRTGQVFIIDRQGLLIASSTGETPFKPQLNSDYRENLNPQEWRLAAQNSRNPLTQASLNFVLTQIDNFDQIQQKRKFKFDFNHEHYFLQVHPISEQSGLDWLIITVVSEADFMKQIYANTRMSILLCITALIGAVGIGILTARWVTKPILFLNNSAKKLAQGEWDKPIEIERDDEVGELSNSFNQMAAYLQQSFAELNNLNEALDKNERKLRGIFNQTFQFIGTLSLDGILLEVNQTALDFAGLQLADVIGKPFCECYWWTISKKTQAQLRIAIKRACKGAFVRYEVDVLGAGDRVFTIDFSLKPIFDQNGKVEFLISEGRDITQRKQAQKILANYNRTLEAQVATRTAELADANQQLKREIAERQLLGGKLYSSTQQVRTIFESITDIVLIIDAQKSIQIIPTKMISEDTTSPSLLNSIVEQFFQQEQSEGSWFAQVQQVLDNQQSINFDYNLRIDNQEVWFTACVSPLLDDSVVWVARDITERKRVEQELRDSKHFIEQIANNSPQLLYLFNPTTGSDLYINRQSIDILGYTPEEILQRGAQFFLEVLHPDDLLLLERNLIYWETAVDGEILLTESRFRHKNGSWRWLLSQEVVFARDENNRVIKVLGTSQDISDRKQTDLELQDSKRFIERIAQASPCILYIYDVIESRNIYSNQEIAQVLGYTPQQIQAMGDAVMPTILHRDDFAKLPENMQKLSNLAEGEVLEREYRMRDAQGEWHTLFGRETVFSRTADGKIQQIIGTATDITERKQVEEKLRQSEAQLNTIITSTSDGIMILDQEGKVRFVNPSAIELCNLPSQNIIDYPWGIPVGETSEIELVDSNRNVRTIEMKTTQTQWLGEFAYVLALRDISDRKQAEMALQERELMLRTLADNLPNGLIYQLVHEPNGNVYFSYITAGIECLVGIKPEVVMQDASVLHNILVEEDRLLNEQLTEKSRRNLSIFEMQMRKRKSTGEIQWSYVRSAPRRLDDGRTVWDGIEIDITNLKQTEAELAKAKEAAEAANRAKSQFLANMSHELRTPLNGILGYAQILQRDKSCTPKQQEGINIIYQCGTHLLTLINDILDLSKIEAGKLELYPEDFHFPAFITGVLEIFQLKAEQKEIHFNHLALTPIPTLIHADEKRLRQVLINLLSNAIKFTDTGSVTFQVKVVELKECENQQQISKIRFQVEDTGIGIKPDKIEKIFLPFEQVGDSLYRGEGTGLGLSISQKIVEIMGSKIYVETTPGVGSKFWFELDLLTVSTEWEFITIESTDNIIGYSGEPQKIMVVDDRWENRTILMNILEPIGFELEEAENGQEGVEKASKFQPDLILADLVMPVMDGYQMVKQLRQLPEFQQTVILAISANAFEVDRVQSLDSGCNDFLAKPIQAKELLNKIKSYLNLSWIYDPENETQYPRIKDDSHGSHQSMPRVMAIPSREELQALYEAAMSGHVDGVEEEVLRLQQLSLEYTPFVTRILELAADFEYEEIAKLIDDYCSEDSQ
jgi:PAS domain S-box-containing protein